MLPDGRSLVDCVGESRFKVQECGDRDGYNVARVQVIEEAERPPDDLLAKCKALFIDIRETFAKKLGVGASAMLKDFLCEEIQENEDVFFWHALSSLPIGDSLKFQVLIVEGRNKRFEKLAGLLNAVLDKIKPTNSSRNEPDDDSADEAANNSETSQSRNDRDNDSEEQSADTLSSEA